MIIQLFPALSTAPASMAPPFVTTWSFAALLLLFCLNGGTPLGHGYGVDLAQHSNMTSWSGSADAKVYIVYLRRATGVNTELDYDTAIHLHLLRETLGSAELAHKSLIYSYKHAINGFSALLSNEHVKTLTAMQGVVQIVPSETSIQPHTTNSWNFIGLSEEGSRNIALRNSTIIGVIDSGVNPLEMSFRDDGLSPVPTRWKGACEGGPGFLSSYCNRKLIGVRYYAEGWRQQFGSYPDEDINAFDRVSAHGTNVASIAGGAVVPFQGDLVSGDMRGGNSLTRLAVYKVLWGQHLLASDADILKAMDDAIVDGVDIINLSLGSQFRPLLTADPIAIGSFFAMRKNILTVHSAGNNGPSYHSIGDTIPWTITVAATTTNRDILSQIQLLGSDQLLPGFSIFRGDMPRLWYDLVPGTRVAVASASIDNASHCRQGSLDPRQANGKIVFCKQLLNDTNTVSEKINYMRNIQVAGTIIEDDTGLSSPPSNSAAFPFSIVSSIVGSTISNYIQSQSTGPMARILRSQAYFNLRGAPSVAGFSSRGPNKYTYNMLKPDIAAPGVLILTADGRQRNTTVFFSGTSQAAPHVSGVASLMRAYHGFDAPWSPSALRSALMTTASVVNDKRQAIMIDAGTREANAYDYGCGEIQPLRAVNQPGPGLIYDLGVQDYVTLMCALGYDQQRIKDVFLAESANCTGLRNPALISQLNFASIAIAKLQGGATIVRTLTNVATAPATYRPSLVAPAGVTVSVSPPLLFFSASTPSLSYTLQIQANPLSPLPPTDPRFGSITWSDDFGHSVRSPIVLHSVYATTSR